MLKVNGLTIAYPDGTLAVDGLSFEIKDGESVALIGANGAGKTSLLLGLVGVIKAKSGTVEAGGITLCKDHLNEIRRNVGLVFQNPDDQLFMPDVWEDVAFGPHNFGMSDEEVVRRTDSTMEELGISHLKGRSSLKLSGGEKRTAAIATVLALEPEIMLFDEPTAFLDPRARRLLGKLLNTIPHSKLIATHNMDFAEAVCSRVLVMRSGKLFAEGGIDLLHDESLMIEAGL
jgi:cobalt/nickel transport system ATP-binding protein